MRTYPHTNSQVDFYGHTLQEELKPHKEYLVSLAKNLLFNATSNSNNVYIMGYSAKPFMEKSQGFVTVLGAMQEGPFCLYLITSTPP